MALLLLPTNDQLEQRVSTSRVIEVARARPHTRASGLDVMGDIELIPNPRCAGGRRRVGVGLEHVGPAGPAIPTAAPGSQARKNANARRNMSDTIALDGTNFSSQECAPFLSATMVACIGWREGGGGGRCPMQEDDQEGKCTALDAQLAAVARASSPTVLSIDVPVKVSAAVKVDYPAANVAMAAAMHDGARTGRVTPAVAGRSPAVGRV